MRMLIQKKIEDPTPASSDRRGGFIYRLVRRVFRENQNFVLKEDETKRFWTIGGVYFNFENTLDERSKRLDILEESETKPRSAKSLNTVDTQSTSSSEEWNSSGSPEHHKGSPLLAKTFSQRRINPKNLPLTQEQLVDRIILKSRQLPKDSGYLASNHVLINNERIKRFVAPLKRMRTLDELARSHARLMAEEAQLFHSDREELYHKVFDEEQMMDGHRIGENVTKGKSVAAIHHFMMQSLSDKNNMLDRRFTWMGVGTAKASDGTLYLCQIFRD